MLLAGSSSLFLILTSLNLSFILSQPSSKYRVLRRLIKLLWLHCSFALIKSLILNTTKLMFFQLYSSYPVLLISLPALRRWWMRVLIYLSDIEVSIALIWEAIERVCEYRLTKWLVCCYWSFIYSFINSKHFWLRTSNFSFTNLYYVLSCPISLSIPSFFKTTS